MHPTATNLAFCIVALGLMALAPSASRAEETGAPIIIAQTTEADDNGEGVPSRRGAVDEADPEDAPPAMPPAAGSGAPSALDIFDAAHDEPKNSAQAPNPARGEVVCLAGCNGPRGTVVYKKPRT